MSRHTYWDSVIPQARSFYVSDIARILRRHAGDEGRPIAVARTIQRAAASGRLRAQGGPDRAVRHYRVLREDLIDWLASLDTLTGREPTERPAAPPPEPEPRRPRATSASSGGRPKKRWFGEQKGLFDD